MRNRIILLILLALTTPLFMAPAYSAVKPGSTCKVYKQKITFNKTVYTCVKSGKKLVWNKAITLNPSQAATSPPLNELWKLNISRMEIAKLAFNNFEIWKNNQIPSSTKIKRFIESTIDNSLAATLAANEDEVAKYLGENIKGPNYSFIGSSAAWILMEIQSRNLNISQIEKLLNIPNRPGNTLQGMSNAENATFIIVHAENIDKSPINDVWKGVGAHEYFHMVQKNIVFNSEFLTPATMTFSFPAWFEEGTAEFAGRIFYASKQKIDYTRIIKQNVETLPKGIPLSDFKWNTPQNPEGKPYFSPYTIGLQATELIVANKGFQALLNIFIEQRKDQNFDAAFERAIGLSIEDFYKYFELVRDKL